MKKALLVVSFGTSFPEAVKAIENIENACKKAYPDYDFYRVFTSGMIIKKIKRTQNLDIMNPEAAMVYLTEQGYEEVLVQPSHIISGIEYDKMMRMFAPYKDQLAMRIGKPLLTSEEDYTNVCKIVMQELSEPLKSDEAFILMGHGTEHSSDGSYARFEEKLRKLGYENTYVGTVEGAQTLEDVIEKMREKQIHKAYLMPLMVVAGDHARNDLAGAEAESWDSILKKEGFETSCIIKGLGEIDAIADIFVEHLKNA